MISCVPACRAATACRALPACLPTQSNLGVHVWSTDLIGGHIGMLVDSTNGQGSNREIFLTHATFDSNWRGLAIADNSYVSVAGCWAASNDQVRACDLCLSFGRSNRSTDYLATTQSIQGAEASGQMKKKKKKKKNKKKKKKKNTRACCVHACVCGTKPSVRLRVVVRLAVAVAAPSLRHPTHA